MSFPSPVPESFSSITRGAGDEARVGEGDEVIKAVQDNRCQFWLPNKRRNCANSALPFSLFCGNHDPSADDLRLPCLLDPSHSVSKKNLCSHLKKCPSRKQAIALEAKTYFSKGINIDVVDSIDDDISSEAKRSAIYGLNLSELLALVKKIDSLHTAIVGDLENSYLMPGACDKWLNRQIDRKIPYQERHVLQQASIIGNMEKFGILHLPKEEFVSSGNGEGNVNDIVQKKGKVQSVVEFGAGRGYLSHVLVDSYGIQKIFLVERRSYKLKADRSLRQNESIHLERLRIDTVEDLNLHAVESLYGDPYLAIGKHLCGNATDLTIKCCLSEKANRNEEVCSSSLQGIALATCCHHLCQWKHYLNRKFFLDRGITKQDFHAMSWFSSWAVDADHSSDPSNQADNNSHTTDSANNEVKVGQKHVSSVECFTGEKDVEETIRNMKAVDRAAFGFKCKDIIDMGRILWLREHGLVAELVKYVPSVVTPENHLLLARLC